MSEIVCSRRLCCAPRRDEAFSDDMRSVERTGRTQEVKKGRRRNSGVRCKGCKELRLSWISWGEVPPCRRARGVVQRLRVLKAIDIYASCVHRRHLEYVVTFVRKYSTMSDLASGLALRTNVSGYALNDFGRPRSSSSVIGKLKR